MEDHQLRQRLSSHAAKGFRKGMINNFIIMKSIYKEGN
jgi:hypothetical protein